MTRIVSRSLALPALVVLAIGAAPVMDARAQPQTPPLLSTTPTPPAGANSEPTQMSGLPLQVGDLPPGTVAVRVIRGSFANNVSKQPVELQTIGPDGRVLELGTDAAGRATFTGLGVGTIVVARTTIDGETLTSQSFELPAEGGVRLVLVAGIGAGRTTEAALPSAAAPAMRPPGDDPRPVAEGIGRSDWWSSTAPVLVVALTLAVVGFGRVRARRESVAGAHRDPAFREALFEALVQIERAQQRGEGIEGYAEKREALLSELVAIESASRSEVVQPVRLS